MRNLIRGLQEGIHAWRASLFCSSDRTSFYFALDKTEWFVVLIMDDNREELIMRCSFRLDSLHSVLLASILTAVVSLLILVTCDDAAVKPDQHEPVVRVVSATSCKGGQESLSSSTVSFCSQDRLQYWSEPDGSLHVKHINAAFNCCMESLLVTIELKGELALITEDDYMTGGGCRCLCLYDVEYEITNLTGMIHKIEVVEPYARLDEWTEEKPLCCSFTLPVIDTGSCSVDRCHYPWHITLLPRITVIGRTGCKTVGLDRLDSVNRECVEWDYRLDNSLTLSHTNTFFSCCLDSISSRMEMHDDTIEIVEREHPDPLCDCICPYDVTLRLADIAPGSYHVVIRHGVWEVGVPSLAWMVDLTAKPSGRFCDTLDLAQ